MKCHFCGLYVTDYKDQKFKPTSTYYDCPRCGVVKLTREAAEDFKAEQFSDEQKKILSWALRSEYEICPL
jgi:hypothetical protein